MKSAINKHGKENFFRETLREFDNKQDAYNFEKLIVDENLVKNTNCYNMCVGGCGGAVAGYGELHPLYGKPISEKTKQKLRELNTGNKNKRFGIKHTEETKKKMRESAIGKIKSITHRINISKSQKGRIMKQETKEKISKANRTHIWIIKNITFNTIREAAKELKIGATTILNWCNDDSMCDCYKIINKKVI